MKRFNVLFLCAFLCLSAAAQDSTKVVKKGWNFGVLPAISFNTDLGFQYGGLINLYHYGDGSRYPVYDHSLYFEASRYTRGSGLLRLAYDSDRLIKNIKLKIDLSYLPEQAVDFIGFNGYESVYNTSWIDDESDDYLSRVFYKFQRNMVRLHVDLNGKFLLKNLRWVAGVEFYSIKVKSVDIDRLNKGKDDSEKLPSLDSVPGLFERYQTWGLISESEVDGGTYVGLKAGLVYDTRDFNACPTKGVWSDVVFYYAPKFLSNLDQGFARLSITHRQYFKIIGNKLWFAYRLNWQGCIAGHVPFYIQPLLITTELRGAYSEGLGGSRSLRGIVRNRVVGNDVLLGNFELRSRIWEFRFIKQNFYVGLSAFVDVGMVTRKIDWADNVQKLIENQLVENNDYFSLDSEKPHWSAGGGLKVVMNENFVIAADYGFALNAQDGQKGLYIGLNYIF